MAFGALVISILLIASAAFFVSWPSPSLSPSDSSGLFFSYPFDVITNGVTPDSSGNGRNGLTDGPVVVNSIFGKVMQFTQTNNNQFINVSGTGIFLSPSFAVSAWVKLDKNTNETGQPVQTILSDGYPGFYPPILFFITESNQPAIKFHASDDPSNLIVASSQEILAKNTWYHLAGELENGHLKLYVNGVLKSDANAQGKVPYNYYFSSVFTVGAHNRGTQWFFNGAMNNLAFYNRSLSDQDLVLLSNYSAYLVDGESVDPVVTLLDPANGKFISAANIRLVGQASDDVQLDRMTLYLWNSSGGLVTSAVQYKTGVLNVSNISVVLPYENDFIWNYRAIDNSSNIAFAPANFTLSYDVKAPSLAFTYPANTTYNDSVTSLSYTANDLHLSSCLYSLNSGGTNNTISCGTSVGNIYGMQGGNIWMLYSNDSAGNTNFTKVSFSVNDITPPAITFSTPQNRSYGFTSLNFNIVLNEKGTLGFTLDGVEYTMGTENNLTFTRSMSGLSAGSHTLIARASDFAGNSRNQTLVFSIATGASNSFGGSGSGSSNWTTGGLPPQTGSGTSTTGGSGPIIIEGEDEQSSVGKLVTIMLFVFLGIIIVGVIIALVIHLRQKNQRKPMPMRPQGQGFTPRPPQGTNY